MRVKQFSIDPDDILEFAEALEELELTGEITGTTEDEEILINVAYSREDSEAIDELEDCFEQEEDEDEEEEEN
jgi:hypothetical protein